MHLIELNGLIVVPGILAFALIVWLALNYWRAQVEIRVLSHLNDHQRQNAGRMLDISNELALDLQAADGDNACLARHILQYLRPQVYGYEPTVTEGQLIDTAEDILAAVAERKEHRKP